MIGQQKSKEVEQSNGLSVLFGSAILASVEPLIRHAVKASERLERLRALAKSSNPHLSPHSPSEKK